MVMDKQLQVAFVDIFGAFYVLGWVVIPFCVLATIAHLVRKWW